MQAAENTTYAGSPDIKRIRQHGLYCQVLCTVPLLRKYGVISTFQIVLCCESGEMASISKMHLQITLS